MKISISVFALALGLSGAAEASTMVSGGSLTTAQADQLETWLGVGDQAFIEIFSGDAGVAKVADFHAAADGAGPTFSIYNITDGYGEEMLIGGYTAANWGGGGFQTDATAFIFNLTTGEKQDAGAHPRTPEFGAQYAIYAIPNYFPTFGAGHDIYAGWGVLGTAGGVSTDYTHGSSDSRSYDTNQGQITVAGDSGYGSGNSGLSYRHWYVNSLEVYTFAAAPMAAVPLPAGLPLLGAGLLSLALLRRRKGA